VKNWKPFQEKHERLGSCDFGVATRRELRLNEEIKRFAVSVKR
jgi:hypothetical protein